MPDGVPDDDNGAADVPAANPPARPAMSLNTAVRRRRADHDFYLRLASTIQRHERAIERLR